MIRVGFAVRGRGRNLDIGRPERVELIFGRRTRGPIPPAAFKTKVVITVNAFYKHSRIKQHLKDGRALRVEAVINDPYDLGCQRRLHNLPELQTRAVPPTAACSSAGVGRL